MTERYMNGVKINILGYIETTLGKELNYEFIKK